MDRAELLDALSDVGSRLLRARVSARVYIVGGAAMILAYDADRATRDVDAVVLAGHGALMDAVRSVGRERGWPGTWLNEQASVFVPSGAATSGRVVFDHPNLRVLAAEPETLLAMKVRAARAADIGDIERLLDLLSIESPEAALAAVERLFPGEAVPRRGALLLDEVFEKRTHG